MKSILAPLVFLLAALCPAAAQNIFVRFSESAYTIALDTPTTFDVVITHDASDGIPDDLFSFGTILLPEPGTPVTLHAIEAVTELDFFGVAGPPAHQDLGAFGIKGTIDALDLAANPYPGSRLATYTMSFSSPGAFDIGLDFFNTLGPTEQIFIAGDGTVLDPYITFVPASFTVIPEPAAMASVALALLACWRILSRKRDAFQPLQ